MPYYNNTGYVPTVQTVLDDLNTIFGDTANAKFTEDEKLVFIRQAVDYAWPLIKNVVLYSTVTLAAGTLEYTPLTTNFAEWGFSTAHVRDFNDEKVMLRRVHQYLAVDGWHILVPDDITRAYDGKILYLQTNRKVELDNPPDLTDTIDIPMDYLRPAACYFFCLAMLPKAPNFDTKPYEPLIAVYKDMADRSKQAHRRGDLPHLIPIVQDLGAGEMTSFNQNGIYSV